MLKKIYNLKKIIFFVLLLTSIILFVFAIKFVNTYHHKEDAKTQQTRKMETVTPFVENDNYMDYNKDEIKKLEDSVPEPTM